MKILFITPSPPNELNRIRSRNIIVALSKMGHEVTLVSLYKNNKEYEWLNLMKKYTQKIIPIHQPVWKSILLCLGGLFLPIPLRVAYCYNRRLRQLLRLIDRHEYDIVYIKRLRMAHYADDLRGHESIFLDVTDSMTKYYERLRRVSGGMKKLLAIEEYFKHKFYEPRIYRRNMRIVVCSLSEASYIKMKFKIPDNRLWVLENGVDMESWQMPMKVYQSPGHRLIFHGVMNVEPNELSMIYFIKEVMPLLQDQYRLSIIGPLPSRRLCQYRSDRIHIEGYVENLRSRLQEADIYICPTVTGAGVKNKILQAALSGLLIVSSELGVEGLNEGLKKFIFIGKDAEDFSRKIFMVSRLPQADVEKRAREQSEFIKKHYSSFSTVKDFFENIPYLNT